MSVRVAVRAAGGVVVLGVLVLCVVAALWRSAGGHWFVVQTPSMGEVLPVGSLVVTEPVAVDRVRVDDVVTFRSPETRTVYTHRVVGAEAGRLTTRGDVNSVADPGTIGEGDLVGVVRWGVPGVGWVLKAVPLLLAGAAATVLVGSALRPSRRRAWRQLGLSLTLAVTNAVLQPWVGLVRLGQRVPEDGDPGLLVDVVSTGMLPVRAIQVDGPAAAALHDGEVATLHLQAGGGGRYDVAAALDLPWWGWVALALVCAAPLLASLLTPRRQVVAE